jgi:zinc transporter ZupT
VAPRLGLVCEREPGAPPRFAQLVGLLFAVVGATGYLLGAPVLGAVATGLALVAALLNAATGFCLGCELYLIVRRAQTARTV